MLERLLMFLSRAEVWLGALGVAAFLALFWALRGAPIGQAARDLDEDEEAPAAGYRDRVVAAMVAGLLVVVAGAYLALTGRLVWSLPAFALGLGVVLTLIAVNRRYRHGSPTLRRTVELANTALNVGLIAGILIVINVLAFRFGGHGIDFTREGTFTLSPSTTNQLKGLKRPVTLTVFFGDSPRSRRQLDRVTQMMDLFKAANPERVTVVYLDPYRELDRYEALLKRFPDLGLIQGGGMLIEYGDEAAADHVVLRNVDLFEDARNDRFEGSTLQFETTFKGEDAVTTALSRLREGKKTKIALVLGHGEPPVTETDPRKAGLGEFKARLTALGYEVVEANLIAGNVPADVALVAVIAPSTPFKPEEADKLKTAFDSGMPLLAVVGGPEKPGATSGLEDLFKAQNLVIGSSAILDPRLNVRGQPFYVYVPITGQVRHPIVDSLANRYILVPRASPITIHSAATAKQAGLPFNPNVFPTPILRTSSQSWGETDLTSRKVERGDMDEPGPLTVGVAVADRPQPQSGKEPKPRMVLISSRFMADNPFLEVEPTNLDVLMNAINWLRGQAEMGGITPKTHQHLTLSAEPLLRARLIMVPTVMSVVLLIGLGLTTYFARRE